MSVLPSLHHRITDVEELVAGLPADARELFHRIFLLDVTTGQSSVPEAMRPWVEAQFGSVEAVEAQTIVRLTNRVTLEGALFNPLRARRPIASEGADLDAEIAKTYGDAFCEPENTTPADIFGRIHGRHAVTASNVAKCDGFHSVIVFREHHPLRFSEEQVIDYFDVALKWAKEAHNADREARYFFMLWNCLWKAGASIVHGHAQVTLTRHMHYPKVEAWRRAGQLYRLGFGSSYFGDLVRVQDALGLAIQREGIAMLPSLTPAKEKEVLVIGERPDIPFRRAVFHVLDTYVRRLGVQSFSLALYWRPIDGVDEDWGDFPTIVRVVDRGPLFSRTADIGSMELYGASVVSSDPFDVARALAL